MQSTLAVISLEKIVRNAHLVQTRTGVPLYAVVKDDAYGHGAERVALALEPHVSGFAVATALEGAALRVAGVTKEILTLTPCLSEEEALCCEEYGLTPAVTSLASLFLMERAADRFGFQLRFHLKVNTGMNRYGFRPEKVKGALREAQRYGAEVAGVYSHLYAPEDARAREEQYSRFCAASERVRDCFPGAVRHLAATGGILAGEKYHFDAVRCGLALYGYLPSGFEGALPVEPAMKVYAAVAQRGRFAGGGVCYRGAEERFGGLYTLRLGYGDGFFRSGRIGNVHELCMDACVREGDAPFGSRRRVLFDAAEYAKAHGTVVYEALVNLAKKAEKVYV